MKKYTVDDIKITEVEYDSRDWWPASARGNLPGAQSAYRYSKEKALCFSTKDGKYSTGAPDSDAFSYWIDIKKGFLLGNTGRDYVFGCKGGLEGAVNCLNKLLSE